MLKELIEKNRKLLADARAKLDEVTADTPTERAKEVEAQYDAMMVEYDERAAKIAREQGLAEREAQAADTQTRLEQRAREGNRPALGGTGEGNEEPISYREAFELQLRYGVNAMTPEARAVLEAHAVLLTPQNPDVRGLMTTAGETGGYTVPQGFSGEIDKALEDWGPMLDPAITRVISTSTGNAFPWPTLDTTALRGDLKSEGADSADDESKDPAFGQKTMNAYVYDSGIVQISYELLQDSAFNMEAIVDEVFGESLGRTGNDVLTVGTGVNEPHGILTAAQTGHEAALANAITPDELIDLQHSINQAYRRSPKCYWQFNDQTLKAIRKLKDAEGRYLWQDASLAAGKPAMLLDKPYKINDSLPNMASGTSPILFGDHSRYIVRRVKDYTMMTFRERYAHQRKIGLMAFMRLDGELLRPSAVKKLTMA